MMVVASTALLADSWTGERGGVIFTHPAESMRLASFAEVTVDLVFPHIPRRISQAPRARTCGS
jgi:hypothetical protein